MQGFYRRARVKQDNKFDNSICQEDGIYCPTFNITYKQLIKAGQHFPHYRGKKVRWLLVDKIKGFIYNNN